jgi:CDP-diacylglycerol--glycerol-3-phosphate 3-phosphatidyltransferase
MSMSSTQQMAVRSHAKVRWAFLGATSLILLKPVLKRLLRPVAAHLAHRGVTANQVTITSLVGSVAVGLAAIANPSEPLCYGAIALWLMLRMGLAAIDGTLAIDFGQKSRLGGILNEAGDVASDVALILPFAFVPPFGPGEIVLVIIFAIVSEVAGMAGPALGGTRRTDGPMGKADRSIVFAGLGMWIACSGSLGAGAALLLPAVAFGSVVTIVNRVRFARAGV